MTFAHSSKCRLNRRALEHFPDDSLFHRLARAVCAAECLPRKELYEAWEVARRTRRKVRGRRVVDLAAGHGLLAYVMLLLDDSSAWALCVDPRRPASAARLAAELEARWPRLAGRVRYAEQSLEEVEVVASDLVVSAHACGALTDRVLDTAIAARAPVAVLPCCHDQATCNTARLEGWIRWPEAVDVARAMRLAQAGYRITTQTIPSEITPQNRLLIGEPQ